jgi:iron complex transport system ATP-binding protein
MLEATGLDVHAGPAAGRSPAAPPAVRGVSLQLGPGWTAIVGPNGAGKTTLLRALAGLLPAAAGQVRLHGRPLAAWPPRERGVRLSWLSQQGEAGAELSVAETVMLGRLPQRGLLDTWTPEDTAAADRAMQLAACSAWRERRLAELSGGERQRVLLARALATEAPVLLLDEPSTHLDPAHQAGIARVLRVQADAGRCVVSVLHDLSLALRADRVLVLAAGELVADGAPDDPTLHAALAAAFGGAIQVRVVDGQARALLQV